MKIQITGKHTDIGDALRNHVETHLGAVITKYFGNTLEGHVVITKEHNGFEVEIFVHIGRGIDVRTHGESADPYAACDEATQKLSHRLSRHKTRLKDHHKNHDKIVETLVAQQYIMDGHDANDIHDESKAFPAIIAEMSVDIPLLSVSDAVMRMDLMDLNALMFKNTTNNTWNMVYRRKDGNIGWVDPSNILPQH